jgi:putative membrane protein
MKEYISIFLKGMAMGIAEVIPGVSGGTIAFITGIYERFINALKSFDLSLFKTLKENGIAGVWKAIDGNFLAALFGGMVTSIILFLKIITWLVDNETLLVWAFFFGLIVSSALFVGRQIEKWNVINIVALVLGVIFAYTVTVLSPSNGSENLFIIFLSGVIAISAMLLPGLSGSFILLILGMYSIVLGGLKDLNIMIAGTFALGCLVGVLSFSRVLSWAFKNYKNLTLAVLTGFMIGSLNRVWPWQEVLAYRTNSHGEKVASFTKSVLPNTFSALETANTPFGNEALLLPVLGLMVVGFALIFFLERVSTKK